jgi:carboxymethylenebutenolidase
VINPRLHRYLDRLNRSQDYLIREFVDNYEDGVMGRRDLVERVFRITGSTAAAAATLLSLGVRPAMADPLASADFQPPAQTGPNSPLSVPENDPAIIAGPVTFPSGGATMMAYWARPRAEGRFPAVMIVHENRGISEHFRDVTRRYAKNGYAAIVLDLLSRQGGTEAVPANEIGSIISGPDAAQQFVEDYQAAMVFLRRQTFVAGDRIGMTGYCFGGGVTWNVLAKEPTLRAAAPYYGTPSFPDELPRARAAVLGVYAEADQRVNATIPTVQQGLQAAGVPFEIKIYPDAGHAFFNDTNPGSYREATAMTAWRDTLAWFATYLRGASLPATGDAGEGDEPEDAGEPSEDSAAEE